MPISRSSPLEAPLSAITAGLKTLVKISSGRAILRAVPSDLLIAKIFGTCSPIVMCSAVVITYASASEIASVTPCGRLSPSSSSKIEATAGSPRKPMPSDVSVIPSWQAAR
jgi:hypothetical protein